MSYSKAEGQLGIDPTQSISRFYVLNQYTYYFLVQKFEKYPKMLMIKIYFKMTLKNQEPHFIV